MNTMLKLIDGCPENVQYFFRECQRRLKQRHNALSLGIRVSKATSVQLVLPGLCPPKQHIRYLVDDRKSPKGKIVGNTKGYDQVVSFNATDVLAWIIANGWATEEPQP